MKNYLKTMAILFTLPLVFSGCENILEKGVSPDKTGMGSFSLTIQNPDAERTIMPTLSEEGKLEEYAYTLEFTPADSTVGDPMRTDRSYGDISAAIQLPLGTWNLLVTAYQDTERLKPIAQGRLEGIRIDGEPVSGEVTLRRLISDGLGTFRWNITLADGVTEATMTIKPISEGGTPEQEINLLESASPDSGIGSQELKAGYYDIAFRVNKPGAQLLEWKEILHIYQNLESPFTFTFSDDYLNGNIHRITYHYYDGLTGETSHVHGETLDDTEAPERAGYEFAGWSVNEDLTTEYANAPIIGDLTLYARWNELDFFTNSDLNGLASWLSAKNPDTTGPAYEVTLMDFNLGNLADEQSGWRQLLGALATGEKYVELDLLGCTLEGSSFNFTNEPVVGGMEYIRGISLPSGITAIGDYAFYYECTDLIQVTLPASLTSIGGGAFSTCANLTQVTLNSVNPPAMGPEAFAGTSPTLRFNVPETSLAAYKNAPGWIEYSVSILATGGIYHEGSFTITFADLADLNDIAGLTLSRSGDGSPQEATIEFTEEYDSNSITWDLYGVITEGPSFTLSLDPDNTAAYNIQYDLPGTHLLRVAVTKDGVPFSKTIIITVIE